MLASWLLTSLSSPHLTLLLAIPSLSSLHSLHSLRSLCSSLSLQCRRCGLCVCDGCSKTKRKMKSNAKAAQRICDQCCQEGPAAEVPDEGAAASLVQQEATAAAAAQHPATQVAHPEQKSGAAGGVSFRLLHHQHGTRNTLVHITERTTLVHITERLARSHTLHSFINTFGACAPFTRFVRAENA